MSRVETPEALRAALTGGLRLRAGGTDLMDLRRLGLRGGPLADPAPGALGPDDDTIVGLPTGGLRLGAALRVAAIGADPSVAARYAGLGAAARGLGTPQIRARASLGGALFQEVRCWYLRSDGPRCLKDGGDTCLARGGDHLYHVVIDDGPCAAPHPSTLAATLLLWAAEAELDSGERVPLSELWGGAGEPRRTHLLPAGRWLVAVHLPPSAAGDRSAYARAANRSRSEWPLVEAAARLSVGPDGRVTEARVALGGVANRPKRAPAVEAALVGRPLGDGLASAAALAEGMASPLPMTGYKVGLLSGCTLEALERAVAMSAAPAPPAPSVGEVSP